MSSVFLFCLNVYLFLSIVCLIFGENVGDRNATMKAGNIGELKKVVLDVRFAYLHRGKSII